MQLLPREVLELLRPFCRSAASQDHRSRRRLSQCVAIGRCHVTSRPIDDAQRKAARIAAAACLLSLAFITVALNQFGFFAAAAIREPAEAARYVLAHEMLFRVGIVADVLCCVALLAFSAALYVILRPVNQFLALVVFSGRLFQATTWLLLTMNLFTTLRLLKDDDYVRAFPADRLPSVARLDLAGYAQVYVGLLFWALGGTVGAYLWLKSGYIPRALAGFGILASGWCAATLLAVYIFPDLGKLVNVYLYDTPMALFEVALSFVLLFRGLRPCRIVDRESPGDLVGR
jgi:hypothetical protein